ncbi:hypothetical protein ACTXT7_011830 [Hymenolepis weldensis]
MKRQLLVSQGKETGKEILNSLQFRQQTTPRVDIQIRPALTFEPKVNSIEIYLQVCNPSPPWNPKFWRPSEIIGTTVTPDASKDLVKHPRWIKILDRSLLCGHFCCISISDVFARSCPDDIDDFRKFGILEATASGIRQMIFQMGNGSFSGLIKLNTRGSRPCGKFESATRLLDIGFLVQGRRKSNLRIARDRRPRMKMGRLN